MRLTNPAKASLATGRIVLSAAVALAAVQLIAVLEMSLVDAEQRLSGAQSELQRLRLDAPGDPPAPVGLTDRLAVALEHLSGAIRVVGRATLVWLVLLLAGSAFVGTRRAVPVVLRLAAVALALTIGLGLLLPLQ